MKMENITTIVYAIAGILLFLYLAGLHVELSPFRAYFTSFTYGAGMLLLSVGMILIMNSTYNRGFKNGAQEFKKRLIEMIQKEEKEEVDSVRRSQGDTSSFPVDTLETSRSEKKEHSI